MLSDPSASWSSSCSVAHTFPAVGSQGSPCWLHSHLTTGPHYFAISSYSAIVSSVPVLSGMYHELAGALDVFAGFPPRKLSASPLPKKQTKSKLQKKFVK
ncbi:hypothetical protein BsWGS_19573 [Bradybaena similaris]